MLGDEISRHSHVLHAPQRTSLLLGQKRRSGHPVQAEWGCKAVIWGLIRLSIFQGLWGRILCFDLGSPLSSVLVAARQCMPGSSLNPFIYGSHGRAGSCVMRSRPACWVYSGERSERPCVLTEKHLELLGLDAKHCLGLWGSLVRLQGSPED